jgi:phosphoglycerol transferase MdoB-like AlkP superfamily enzyme
VIRNNIISSIYHVFTRILYFILELFLKSYKSKLKNFLSVSLISFKGILCYIFSRVKKLSSAPLG